MEMNKKKILGEAALYGLLGTVYTSLFFFGALYPQFGIPSQSIVCESEMDDGEIAEEKTDGEKVVYKSLLMERLKEWF